AREDPVVILERMRRAGLHRLVIPEDRVRPDASLAVVDHRALLVRPQQHHRAVQLEQLLLAEAFDLPILVDHTAELVLAWGDLGHVRKGTCCLRAVTPSTRWDPKGTERCI